MCPVRNAKGILENEVNWNQMRSSSKRRKKIRNCTYESKIQKNILWLVYLNTYLYSKPKA